MPSRQSFPSAHDWSLQEGMLPASQGQAECRVQGRYWMVAHLSAQLEWGELPLWGRVDQCPWHRAVYRCQQQGLWLLLPGSMVSGNLPHTQLWGQADEYQLAWAVCGNYGPSTLGATAHWQAFTLPLQQHLRSSHHGKSLLAQQDHDGAGRHLYFTSNASQCTCQNPTYCRGEERHSRCTVLLRDGQISTFMSRGSAGAAHTYQDMVMQGEVHGPSPFNTCSLPQLCIA